MKNRISMISTVAIAALLTAGCNMSPTAPGNPQPEAGLELVSGDAKGGNGGGNGGGGNGGGGGDDPTSASLTLTQGMQGGPESLSIQENKRELSLHGAMSGVTTAISGASGCVVMQGDPVKADLSQEQALALADGSLVSPFAVAVVVDKTAIGSASNRHRVTLNWDQTDGRGTYILNVTEGVSVAQSGSDYTFSGGYVRIEGRRGRKDSVIWRCTNNSSIVATVDIQ